MDTNQKRAAIGQGLPADALFPEPDGSVSSNDLRAMIGVRMMPGRPAEPTQSKFSPYKFLGASAVSFDTIAGYSESSTSAVIRLVEDLDNGDVFTSGIIGAPYRFQASGLVYDGILQSIQTAKSTAGNPTYDVKLTSPTQILDGCKVILGSYNGTTNYFKNLLNVYGYYEDYYGFGGSQSNDSGMPWLSTYVHVSGIPWSGSAGLTITSGDHYGVMPGIQYLLTNSTPFGSGIYYKGFHYVPNLSGLPVPPSYYRVGNTSSASLLELVSQVCQDAGAEFIVSLKASVDASGNPDGGTNIIDIKTYLKSTVAPLGKIDEFVAAQSGLVVSYSKGVEMRNMENSIFITGENLQTLFYQTNPDYIQPFWGFDVYGNPILGTGYGDQYNFNLNALPIYDVINGVVYNATNAEMRFALSSYDMWAGYVEWKNPTLARFLELPSTFSITETAIDTIFNQPVFPHDFVGQSPDKAYNLGSSNTSNGFVSKGQKVYDFVRRYAEEYYGKKFLVATPTPIYARIEAETERVIYSWEPCDGGYLPEGSQPLGLSPFNEDLFRDDDNNFRAFVYINGQGSGNYTSITNGLAVSQGTNIYLGAQVLTEYGVLYQNQFGYQPSMVVVELESPFFENPKDALGGTNNINNIFSYSGLIDYSANYDNGSMGGRLHPGAFSPSGVAFPMRSTQFTYGPWGSGGLDGKVEYRQHPDYAPWKYGGYDVMNAAANSEIQNFVSNAQEQETGSITVIGTPIQSLGDILLENGPIITEIHAQFSTGGIQTTYDMQSYTPRAGYFSRDNIERFRKYGLSLSNLRRNLRQLYRNGR